MGEKVPLKKRIEQEKEKFSKLDRHGKLMYFRDYYLIKVLIVIAVLIGIAWFARDVFQNKQIAYAGAGVGVNISEASENVLTSDFISYLGSGYKKKVAKYGGNVLVVPQTGGYNEGDVEAAFISQMTTGMFQYLLMTKDQFEYFLSYDYYLDLSKYKNDSKYSDKEFLFDIKGNPVAIRIPDGMKTKLGITADDVYLAFVYSENPSELNERMLKYIFS